jgi:hemoglobin/transferrin/lactoferrin receptor protein
MLIASTGRASERDNQGTVGGTGPARTEPNPQDAENQGLLAKLTFEPDAAHRFTLTAEDNRSEVESDVLTSVGTVFAGVRTDSFDADDRSERRRYSLAHRLERKTALFDRLHWTLYTQQGSARQEHVEQRRAIAAPGVPRLRFRSSTFEQDVDGLALQLNKSLTTAAGIHHLLTYGADHDRIRSAALRTGREIRRDTGAFVPGGAPFQTRDFPVTDTRLTGVFVQNEIFFPGDRLSVTPALRYDRYAMTPRPDAAFAGPPPAGLKDAVFTPRLGVMYAVTPLFRPYANYAHGYRAPNYSEVNSGFTLPGFYSTIPNPDLEPETSRGVEVGVKGADARLGYQLAVFDNRYEDFIEMATLNCPSPVGNPARDPQCSPLVPTTFQSRNLAEVRIYGAEARAEYRIDGNWRLKGNLAWHRGEDRSRQRPLDSINPARGSLSLAYAPGRWGVEARLAAAAKNERVDESGGARFKAPAWHTLDLTGFARPGKNATLRVGVHNLTDEKYWHAGDVRGLAPTHVALDRFTRPGRNVAARFEYVF